MDLDALAISWITTEKDATKNIMNHSQPKGSNPSPPQQVPHLVAQLGEETTTRSCGLPFMTFHSLYVWLTATHRQTAVIC